LSLLQVSLLTRKRNSENLDNKAKGKIDDALATTLSGVAQGLRNTG
jgi:phosphoenolpyruvate carboxylase